MKHNNLMSFIFRVIFGILLINGFLLGGDFTLDVNNSTGGPLSGVKVSYNDYGTHYVTLGTTDATGTVSATLPDGTYKFQASLNHTSQFVTQTASGTVQFQTSEYVAHVTDSDGADFLGIAASFNDYGTHYVAMGNTDASGNASIELFPGTRKLRAYKDHTEVTGDLTIGTSGTSDTIDFQTSEYVVHVTDSDGADFPGIAASFNDYGTHYLSMGNTDASGNASIELFAGTRKLRAYKDHTDITGDFIAVG